jgi:hypothetical protein
MLIGRLIVPMNEVSRLALTGAGRDEKSNASS